LATLNGRLTQILKELRSSNIFFNINNYLAGTTLLSILKHICNSKSTQNTPFTRTQYHKAEQACQHDIAFSLIEVFPLPRIHAKPKEH
jgi:hypothetical protein